MPLCHLKSYIEFPLETHAFIPGQGDTEKCGVMKDDGTICQRYRAMHVQPKDNYTDAKWHSESWDKACLKQRQQDKTE